MSRATRKTALPQSPETSAARRRAAAWAKALTLFACIPALLSTGAAARIFTPSPANGIVLVSPAPGSRLIAGQRVALSWRPGANFSRLAWTEEWEAFLSLDGGRSFSLRITPHLDRKLRTVFWRVPDLPSDDVRLLLRLGDETHEVLVPLSARFEIVPTEDGDPRARGPWDGASLVFADGEPALPGVAGVVAWSEGGREGGPAHWVAAICWQSEIAGVRNPVTYDPPPAAVRDPVSSRPSPGAMESRVPVAASYQNLDRDGALSVRDLLLLSDRRNE